MSSDIYKRTLYVKNLSQPSDDTISSLFGSFGKFTHQVVFTSDSNRKDLFLEFESEDQASNARSSVHGKVIDGNNLYVDYATQIPITSSSSNQQQKSKTSVFDRIIKTTDPNYPKTDEKATPVDKQPSDKERIAPSSEKVQQSPSKKNKPSAAKSRDESSESNAKKPSDKADSLQIKKPDGAGNAVAKKLEITKPKKESHSVSNSKETPSVSKSNPVVRRVEPNHPLRQSHDRSNDDRYFPRSRSRTKEKSPPRTHLQNRRSRSHSSSRNQQRSSARRSHSRSRSHERKYGRSRSPHRDHYYDRREGDYRRDRDYRRSRSPGYRERDREREKPYPQKLVIGGGLVIEKKGQSRYGDDNGRDYRRSHSRERLHRRSRSRSHDRERERERSYNNKASTVGKVNAAKNFRNQKQKPNQNQTKTNGKNNGKANSKKHKNAMAKTGGRNKPQQQMIDYYISNQNLGFVMASESGVIANSSNLPLYGNYYPQYQEQLVPLPISNNFFNYSNPPIVNYENQAEVSNLPSYLHQPAEIPVAVDYNIYNPAQNFIENPPLNAINDNGNVPIYHQYEAGQANEIKENLMEEETAIKPQTEQSPAENTNDTSQVAEEKESLEMREEPKPENPEPEPEPKFQLTNEYIRKNNLGNLVNLLIRHGSIEELKQKLNLK